MRISDVAFLRRDSSLAGIHKRQTQVVSKIARWSADFEAYRGRRFSPGRFERIGYTKAFEIYTTQTCPAKHPGQLPAAITALECEKFSAWRRADVTDMANHRKGRASKHPVPWTFSPVALAPVNGCSAGDTLRCNQKIVQKASLDWTSNICPTRAQTDTGAVRSLWRMLSL